MHVQLDKHDITMIVDSLEYMKEVMKKMVQSTGYQPYTLEEIESMCKFLDGFYNQENNMICLKYEDIETLARIVTHLQSQGAKFEAVHVNTQWHISIY